MYIENQTYIINCEMYPTEKATVKIIFGLYSEHKKGRPHHTHYLCDRATKELWEECEAAVNLGFMHFKIEKNENGRRNIR